MAAIQLQHFSVLAAFLAALFQWVREVSRGRACGGLERAAQVLECKIFSFTPKKKKLTLRCPRRAPWPCILSVWCSSCTGTAAAAHRVRARARFRPRSNYAQGGITAPLTQRRPQWKLGWPHVKFGHELLTWPLVFRAGGNGKKSLLQLYDISHKFCRRPLINLVRWVITTLARPCARGNGANVSKLAQPLWRCRIFRVQPSVSMRLKAPIVELADWFVQASTIYV